MAEQYDEKEFIKFIAKVKEVIETGASDNNDDLSESRKLRREQFDFAYDTMVKLFEQFPNTTVKKEYFSKTAGSIVIEGLPIAIARPKLFFKVVSMANNFEVATKYKKIMFAMMFYGI